MVTVKTTTVTAVTESYTKKEKKKVVTTKVTTTTQTTTTDLSQGAQSGDGVAAKQTRTDGSAAGALLFHCGLTRSNPAAPSLSPNQI